ncbi:MAG: alginate O-acetyltransferase AlgX-related protein [Ignavibacteria bacterium]
MRNSSKVPFVSAILFAAFLVAGFVAAVVSLRGLPDADWRRLADPEKVMDGQAARHLGRLIDERFVLRKPFERLERSIAYGALGDLGPRVRAGCDGWLFLADEFELHPEASEARALRAGIVKRVASLLAERHIGLVVAVVPDKSRVEARHLCKLRRPGEHAGRMERWLTDLRSLGVDAVDLAPALLNARDESFLRTDSHWNEAGADAAARAVAASLRANRLIATPPVGIDAARDTVAEHGDLVRVAGLEAVPGWLRPASPMTVVSRLPRLPAADAGDLFDDAALPKIVLLGTSFSRNGNFVPLLERHLGAQVADASKAGGDFDGATRDYLASRAFRQTPPVLVIWEIPERVIEMPISENERDWSAALQP